jgi:hypothetical protein
MHFSPVQFFFLPKALWQSPCHKPATTFIVHILDTQCANSEHCTSSFSLWHSEMNLGTISQTLKAGLAKSFCTKLDPVILVVLEGHNLPFTDHRFLSRLHTQRSKAHLSCSG